MFVIIRSACCFLGLLLVYGCVSLRPVPPPLNLSERELTALVDRLALERQKADSFFMNGTLYFQGGLGRAEAALLAAGTRNPFRLKIEVAHSWGTPLLHVLIDQDHLEVLAFTEQTHYVGKFHPRWMARFFGTEISADVVWEILRGYPPIRKEENGRAEGANPITFFDKDNRPVQQITIEPDSLLPVEAFFPETQLCLRFSEFQQSNQVFFAKKVEVSRPDRKRILALNHAEAVFNREIPAQIFSLTRPPNFKTIELNEQLFDSLR